jgi:hypothetical protein
VSYREQDDILLVDLPDQTTLHLSTSNDYSGIYCGRYGNGPSASVIFEPDGAGYAVDGFRLGSHGPNQSAILGAQNLLHERSESWIFTASPEGTRGLTMSSGDPPTFIVKPTPASGASDIDGRQAELSRLDAAARTIWEDLGLLMKG